MMEKRVLIAKIDNNSAMYEEMQKQGLQSEFAVCFDTGLDPRAFARTKMSQSLIEKGYVVSPDGTHTEWKAAGVKEVNNLMRVWGPLFAGKRLDLLLEGVDSVVTDSAAAQQTALFAVASWIRAKMFLGDKKSTLNPGACFLNKTNVYFAPEHLSNRCLFIEGSEIDRYNCPDLVGMDAVAFCAGVMLYKVLTKSHPYPTADIFQDMREGIFLPINLAVPDIDEELAILIHAALSLPAEKKRTSKSGTDILAEILELIMDKQSGAAKTTAVNISELFVELSAEKKLQAEKEKKSYLLKQKIKVGTRRFVTSNKYLLIGIGIGVLFLLFVVFSTARGFSQRPTTSGMDPFSVVTAYYDSFNSLNHILMDACIMGADKTDVNVVTSVFAISRTRQAHENRTNPPIISARAWLESGGTLPAPDVFGVTDLNIIHESGTEFDKMVIYRINYSIWAPNEHERKRTDVLTLRKDRRKHWRIIEILRTER
ncbi:MAG: hypothetical protein FWB86_05820 [Treponema sp.]|nr:hypothetical protein [Treponema sp.]MCL2251460.1 hypothetical protein [Treponema sp.]